MKKEDVYRVLSVQIDNTNYEFDPIKLQIVENYKGI
jgi:hypothetical protein